MYTCNDSKKLILQFMSMVCLPDLLIMTDNHATNKRGGGSVCVSVCVCMSVCLWEREREREKERERFKNMREVLVWHPKIQLCLRGKCEQMMKKSKEVWEKLWLKHNEKKWSSTLVNKSADRFAACTLVEKSAEQQEMKSMFKLLVHF